MIDINGTYFLDDTQGIVSSLFNPINGKTASGTYKRYANKVHFYDENERLFACCIDNGSYSERFFVSASIAGGKARYNHAISSPAKIKLGLDKVRYTEAQKIVNSIFGSNNK